MELLELELFETLEVKDQNRHLYALLKRIYTMSTTEAEAITNLQTAVAAVDTKITDLTTAVGQVIAAAGDNPAKVAALDGISSQLATESSKLQTLTDSINAALVPPVVPTP